MATLREAWKRDQRVRRPHWHPMHSIICDDSFHEQQISTIDAIADDWEIVESKNSNEVEQCFEIRGYAIIEGHFGAFVARQIESTDEAIRIADYLDKFGKRVPTGT
ncbi:MAG: hypothetical protein U0798_15230 [Gemmataceae bacterium]